ncbi:MAG: hypothetical protein ACP5N2_06675 [Candidatus Nanoarchaeia archaeon]
MNRNKPKYVSFKDKKSEKYFELLFSGKFEEKQLFEEITATIESIKNKPDCGIKIKKELWPVKYIKEYKITNLWKVNLSHGWRLIYTIKENEILVLCVILDWFDHKEYEKAFKY